MTTQTLTQSDKTFYPALGPFFVDPAVRQATGSAMTSLPDYRWSVVREGRRVVALAGLAPHKNGNAELVAVYAVGGDVSAKRAALEAALADAQAQGLREVRVLAKIENSDFYRELGFQDGVMRGAFRQFTRALSGS